MFRRLCVLGWLASACSLVAAEAPNVDEIVQLDGAALFENADKVSYELRKQAPTSDLIRLAEKLSADRAQIEHQDKFGYVFDSIFEAACQKSEAVDVDRLIAIYVGLDAGSFTKNRTFAAVAAAWINRELIALRDPQPHVTLPEFGGALPEKLQNITGEASMAWREFKRAELRFSESFGKREQQSIGFQANERAFYRLLDDLLLGRADKAAERLAPFEWGGGCGTGSDALYQPKSIAMFMALLRERSIAEAVGAAVRINTEKPLTNHAHEDLRIEFLKMCGLDWETIFAGALFDGMKADGYSLPPGKYLDELAIYGSESAARAIIEAARNVRPQSREQYARALIAFIPGSTENMMLSASMGVDRIAPPISEPARVEVLHALEDFATANAPSDLLRYVLVGLARARNPSTSATLHRLLEHRSHEIAEAAGQVLRSMGELVAVTKKESAPVRFQVLLNGKALPPGFDLAWQINYAEGGSTSSSRSVDENSSIELDGDNFVDGERHPASLQFSSHGWREPEAPFFIATIPLPANLDAVTRVDVEALPLQLTVHSPAGEKTASLLKIRRHPPERDPAKPYEYFDSMQRELPISTDAPVQLATQAGAYDVEVLSPGAERVVQTITVNAAAAPLDIQLRRGADVHVQIIRPDGERDARHSITRDGKPVEFQHYEWETKTYRGLARGKYLLHVPSSAELRGKSRGRVDLLPAYIGYGARDVSFTIDEQSPALIDLGEIHLDPAAD